MIRSKQFARWTGVPTLLLALAACAAPVRDGPGEGQPTISISPTQGAPGAQVEVSASGMPPSTPMEIGFGPPASEYEVVQTTQSDARGDVTATVQVPSWAEAGRDYVFVVAEVDGPGRARVVSNTFRVGGG